MASALAELRVDAVRRSEFLRRAALACVLIQFVVACAGQRAVDQREAPQSKSAPSSYLDGLQARVGKSTKLTVDRQLQKAAEDAIVATGRAGAIVVFEPDTGVVRALFSVPGERGDPLLVAHIPGSAFKTFTAIAGLEAGALTPTTEKQCTGRYEFGGKEFRCFGVHGRETTAQAIVRSCNVFFFDVATQVDPERILEVARRFGFGERTGIELPDGSGAVPSGEARDPAGPGPLADAIGHGQVKVTLLQLARAYAVIANGGKLVRLRVTERAREAPRAVALAPEHLELVRGVLIDVVAAEDGTAHALMTPGFPFAGKTGTGEAPPLRPGAAEQDDQWFVAYAPPSEPKILVAARVERFGPGADAKIAVKRVLDAWRAAPRSSEH